MSRLTTLLRRPRRRADRPRWTADDLQVMFETTSPSQPTAEGVETSETRALVAGGFGAHLR